MSQHKVCKSCCGKLDEFEESKIIREGFCPFCVDKQGKIKSYGDILGGMLDYIKEEHKEIEVENQLSTAHKWLREGEVWKERYVADNIVIDIVRKGDLEKIKSHEHKEEGFSHSCGECMYYQGKEDSISVKREWLGEMQKKHGTCANVLYYKDELVGFLQYAPKSEFSKLEELESGSTKTEDWYISCVFIDSDLSKKVRQRLVRLSLRYILKDLKIRKVNSAQISVPVEDGVISSIPFIWGFYEKLGFDKISSDELYVTGRIKL